MLVKWVFSVYERVVFINCKSDIWILNNKKALQTLKCWYSPMAAVHCIRRYWNLSKKCSVRSKIWLWECVYSLTKWWSNSELWGRKYKVPVQRSQSFKVSFVFTAVRGLNWYLRLTRFACNVQCGFARVHVSGKLFALHMYCFTFSFDQFINFYQILFHVLYWLHIVVVSHAFFSLTEVPLSSAFSVWSGKTSINVVSWELFKGPLNNI